MHGRDLRRNQGGNYNNYGYYNGNNNNNRGGQTRNHVIPNEPPYTAYIGNAPDTMVQGDFEHQLFVGLKVKQVRLVRDRQTDRFRGFAYVDFEDADSLRSAIALDGTFVNDRPIRIDIASRPLDAAKSEGFRNKPGFEVRNSPRQTSGNNNNTRSGGGFRQSGRNSNQYEESQIIDGNYHENGYNIDNYYKKRNSNEQTDSHKNNERQSQAQKEETSSSSRKISDDVFIAPDTPISNEDENQQQINNQDDTTAMTRQKSRNWADCPIDDSVVDISPSPPSINNTFTSHNDTDDFQIIRNKTPKSRSNNQYTSSRSMGNPFVRGHNSGSHSYGLPLSGNNRHFYDQISSPSYSNQSQSYYHNNSQISSVSFPMGLSYHNNRQQLPSSGSHQRLNSNRNYQDNQSNKTGKRLTSATSNSSYDITTTSTENRPRLQLLPRSQKLSSSTDDNQSIESTTRNLNIFGLGKPRDERDPKIAELNKHIEEVVEKEQHIKSPNSNESTIDFTKPIRILTARSESSIDH